MYQGFLPPAPQIEPKPDHTSLLLSSYRFSGNTEDGRIWGGCNQQIWNVGESIMSSCLQLQGRGRVEDGGRTQKIKDK